MKKTFVFLLIISILGKWSIPIISAESNLNNRYTMGLDYLYNNGFDEKIISIMSKDEVSKYADASKSISTAEYCAYIYNSASNEITKEHYTESEYQLFKNSCYSKEQQSSFENENTYSWIKLTITSTYLYDNRFIILTTFEWLSNPIVRYTDVIALTFDSRNIPQSGTGEASLAYTNSAGRTQIEIFTPSIQYSSLGVFTELDIPGWGNSDMYGYLSVETKVNSISGGSVPFNNWAYYAHKSNALSFNVSVSFPSEGAISFTPSNAFNVANVGLISTYEP